MLIEIPGYSDAVEKEIADRDAAFLPVPQELCGVPVNPFSIRHFALLSRIGSPFLCGGVPDAVDVARFVWIVSEKFDPADTKARDKCTRRVGRAQYQAALEQIYNYLGDALADSPSQSKDDKTKEAPAVSAPASLVDLIASNYGWDEDYILDMPMVRVWQYVRCIIRRNDPKAQFYSGSDRIVTEYFRKLNEVK